MVKFVQFVDRILVVLFGFFNFRIQLFRADFRSGDKVTDLREMIVDGFYRIVRNIFYFVKRIFHIMVNEVFTD